MTGRSAPHVTTTNGPVVGGLDDGVESFLEVPYGASTAGTNRFRRSVPPAPWTQPRAATRWRNRTPQYLDPAIGRTPRQWFAIQGDYFAPDYDEDSLTVNIWTPTSGSGTRPVLFWIHGGGFTVGHAGSDMSHGANIAREHNLVFVSVTHRLNALGFLDLSELGGDKFASSGINGMLDLVDALRWVQDNIERFGGDPHNVTIIGESGGGAKVTTLLAMPEADGLFHAAICQSGVATWGASKGDSQTYAERLIEHLGGSDINALLTAHVDDILSAQLAVEKKHPTFSPRPVIDGTHLLGNPIDEWLRPGRPDVPVLLGSTRDEVTPFSNQDLELDLSLPAPYHHGAGRGEPTLFNLESGPIAVSQTAEKDAQALIDLRARMYPEESERTRVQRLVGDIVFRRPGNLLAQRWAHRNRDVFVYRFDWTSPLIAELGSPHSSAVSFFFGNTDRVPFARSESSARMLAHHMSNCVATFAKQKRPRSEGLPGWPAYDLESRAVMIFDRHPHIEHDPEAAIRTALDDLAPASLL